MLLIDRSGRKSLLMSAFGGLALSLVAVSAAIHFQASGITVLIFVLTYVACFAVGVGTGTWVLMAEICPTQVRGQAMSLATVFLLCRTLLGTLTCFSLVLVFTSADVIYLSTFACLPSFVLSHTR